MSINKSRFEYLIKQYLNKSATANEFEELFGYINDEEYKEALFELMKEDDKTSKNTADVHTIDWDSMYAQIVKPSKPIHRKLFGTAQMAVAAALLCVVSIGIYFWTLKQQAPITQNIQIVQNDIPPGGNKAILKLADGSEIVLDHTNKGVLTEQGSTKVSKQEEGLLVYNAKGDANNDKVLYNTLSTPKGGQYMLVLPDNSKVWLNSASSITFPAKFNSKERNVEITGEVYFEVAKHNGQSFIVTTGKAKVEVLGTHFNIMSYPDENSSQITLFEGSIRLKLGNTNKILAPGQLASYQPGSSEINIRNLESPEAKIDWKNGLFQFENESLEEIMRKISRWYDRDVVYNSPHVINKHFTGTIPRNNNVSKILNLLQSSGGLTFEIKDKIITVTDKKD